jgi:hypothetical protein
MIVPSSCVMGGSESVASVFMARSLRHFVLRRFDAFTNLTRLPRPWSSAARGRGPCGSRSVLEDGKKSYERAPFMRFIGEWQGRAR